MTKTIQEDSVSTQDAPEKIFTLQLTASQSQFLRKLLPKGTIFQKMTKINCKELKGLGVKQPAETQTGQVSVRKRGRPRSVSSEKRKSQQRQIKEIGPKQTSSDCQLEYHDEHISGELNPAKKLLLELINKFVKWSYSDEKIKKEFLSQLIIIRNKAKNQEYATYQSFEKDILMVVESIQVNHSSRLRNHFSLKLKGQLKNLKVTMAQIQKQAVKQSEKQKKSLEPKESQESKDQIGSKSSTNTAKRKNYNLKRNWKQNSPSQSYSHNRLDSLMTVAEETEPETGSELLVTCEQAAQINTLLKKLCRYDQQTLLSSLHQAQNQHSSIKSLNRREAILFRQNIERTLKRNGISFDNRYDSNQKSESSSFEVVSDED